MFHCGFTVKGNIEMELNSLLFNHPLIYIRNDEDELVFSDTRVSEISLWELLNHPPIIHHWSHEFTGSDIVNIEFLPIGDSDFYLSHSGSELIFTTPSLEYTLSELANRFPLPHAPTHSWSGTDSIDLDRLPVSGSDAHLSRSGSDLTFTDPVTGTKTLAELAKREIPINSMSFWSNIMPEATITSTPTDIVLPSVILDLPSGSDLIRADAIVKIRALENTNTTEINMINGDQFIQVGTNSNYIDGIKLIHGQWELDSEAREFGDVLFGNLDVSLIIESINTMVSFKISNATTTQDSMKLNDIMTGIKCYFRIQEGGGG